MIEKFIKTTKIKIGFIMVLVLLFQAFLCIFSNKNVALAKNIDAIDNIEITNESGVKGNDYIPGERVKVYVYWSIKGTVKKGDNFIFDLPKELRGFNGVIELKDKNGISYGTGIGNKNTIIFTFASEVERRKNISGYFYVESQIKYMKSQGYKKVLLQFKINGRSIFKEINVNTGSGNRPIGKINEVFNKFGKVSDDNKDILEWVIRVNYKGDTLNNCHIYDTLESGHELIPNSIRIYKGYTNFSNGNIENLRIVPLNSVKSHTDKRRFDLYLNVDRAVYIICYKTKIINNNKYYGNKAVLQATGKVPIYIYRKVKTFSSGGGACGDLKKFQGKLKIINQDEKTKLGLSDAEFELLDHEQKKIVAKLKTDENGEAITDNIPSGTYYLRETKAPSGYELQVEDSKISLNFKENNVIEQIITNKKKESKVEPDKSEVKEPEIIIDPDDDVPLGNPDVSIDDKEKPENTDTTENSKEDIKTETIDNNIKEDKLQEESKKPQDPEIIVDSEEKVSLGNIQNNKTEEKPKDNIKPTNKKVNSVKDSTYNTIKMLPKTGESSKALFYISGLIIIILGIFIKKKR